MKILKNQRGFGLIEGLLAVIAITLVVGVGYYVYNANKNKSGESNSLLSQPQKEKDTNNVAEEDPNEGYLVVQEWGLRFKIPENLTDVRYKISGDTLAIFAKPIQDENGKSFDVEYPSNYDKIDEYGNFSYTQGDLIRSKKASMDYFGEARKGKKVGDYYYYTSHSFSGLASGAGPNGIFLDQDCRKNDLQKKCERYFLAESIVFAIVNGTSIHPETNSEVKDALLPSIELM